MYQGFRLYLGKRSVMNIFWSLLTTYAVSAVFFGRWGSWKYWLVPKIETPNQVNLV